MAGCFNNNEKSDLPKEKKTFLRKASFDDKVKLLILKNYHQFSVAQLVT